MGANASTAANQSNGLGSKLTKKWTIRKNSPLLDRSAAAPHGAPRLDEDEGEDSNAYEPQRSITDTRNKPLQSQLAGSSSVGSSQQSSSIVLRTSVKSQADSVSNGVRLRNLSPGNEEEEERYGDDSDDDFGGLADGGESPDIIQLVYSRMHPVSRRWERSTRLEESEEPSVSHQSSLEGNISRNEEDRSFSLASQRKGPGGSDWNGKSSWNGKRDKNGMYDWNGKHDWNGNYGRDADDGSLANSSLGWWPNPDTWFSGEPSYEGRDRGSGRGGEQGGGKNGRTTGGRAVDRWERSCSLTPVDIVAGWSVDEWLLIWTWAQDCLRLQNELGIGRNLQLSTLLIDLSSSIEQWILPQEAVDDYYAQQRQQEAACTSFEFQNSLQQQQVQQGQAASYYSMMQREEGVRAPPATAVSAAERQLSLSEAYAPEISLRLGHLQHPGGESEWLHEQDSSREQSVRRLERLHPLSTRNAATLDEDARGYGHSTARRGEDLKREVPRSESDVSGATSVSTRVMLPLYGQRIDEVWEQSIVEYPELEASITFSRIAEEHDDMDDSVSIRRGSHNEASSSSGSVIVHTRRPLLLPKSRLSNTVMESQTVPTSPFREAISPFHRGRVASHVPGKSMDFFSFGNVKIGEGPLVDLDEGEEPNLIRFPSWGELPSDAASISSYSRTPSTSRRFALYNPLDAFLAAAAVGNSRPGSPGSVITISSPRPEALRILLTMKAKTLGSELSRSITREFALTRMRPGSSSTTSESLSIVTAAEAGGSRNEWGGGGGGGGGGGVAFAAEASEARMKKQLSALVMMLKLYLQDQLSEGRDSMDCILTALLEITSSKIGFVAAVESSAGGEDCNEEDDGGEEGGDGVEEGSKEGKVPNLKILASNFEWSNDPSVPLPSPDAFEFDLSDVRALFLHISASNSPLIRNRAAPMPSVDGEEDLGRSMRPSVFSVLAIPLYSAGCELIGICTVANRRRGYSEDVVEQIRQTIDCVGAIVHAIMERRRQLEVHSLALCVLKMTREGVFTVDKQGLITSMNPAARRMFGQLSEDLDDDSEDGAEEELFAVQQSLHFASLFYSVNGKKDFLNEELGVYENRILKAILKRPDGSKSTYELIVSRVGLEDIAFVAVMRRRVRSSVGAHDNKGYPASSSGATNSTYPVSSSAVTNVTYPISSSGAPATVYPTSFSS